MVCIGCATRPATTGHAFCRSCLSGSVLARCSCGRPLTRGACLGHCDHPGESLCGCASCQATAAAIARLSVGMALD